MDWKEKSAKEIALLLHAAEASGQVSDGITAIEACLEQLAGDERKSVQTLVKRYRNQLQRAEAEAARLSAMWQYEKEARANGYQWIAGTDEVGRGPLAGPVVAAAVILPDSVDLPGINDSKKLTEAQREHLNLRIREKATAFAIAAVDEKQIDQINILEASRLAMQLAVSQLETAADFVLVDGLSNPNITLPSKALVKGDSRSISIAAASILAKVYRDHLMVDLDKQYPQYGFAEHKGYPTEAHLKAIAQYGPCAIHRMTFKPLNGMY